MCCFLCLSLDVGLFNFVPFFLLYLTLLGNVMYHMSFELSELHLMQTVDTDRKAFITRALYSLFKLFCLFNFNFIKFEVSKFVCVVCQISAAVTGKDEPQPQQQTE